MVLLPLHLQYIACLGPWAKIVGLGNKTAQSQRKMSRREVERFILVQRGMFLYYTSGLAASFELSADALYPLSALSPLSSTYTPFMEENKAQIWLAISRGKPRTIVASRLTSSENTCLIAAAVIASMHEN